MSTHRAIVCKDNKGYKSLVFESVQTPVPEGDEVLIEIEAAGMNYPDVLITQGKYQFQPPYPFSPGGEFAGRVIARGDKAKKLNIGDRIVALPGWGAFQEKAVISEDKCIKIPTSMPSLVAAGFLFTYGTSIHALKDRGQLKVGQTCLILGAAGGVGIAAIEISKALGATVIAAASTKEKLEVCKKFGADYVINYTEENLKNRVMEITKSVGVDVVYDAVGGSHAEPAIRSMAWRGRYLVIGFVGGIPKIPLNLTLLKGCSIVGVFWGSFTNREPQAFEDDVKTLVKWYEEKRIKPAPTQVFSLQEAPKAIGLLEDRKIMGKAVVVCDSKAKL